MLKLRSCLFILLLSALTVYLETEARPQLKVPIQAFARISGLNDSKITFIKRVSSSNLTRDDNNKTKTRILFRVLSTISVPVSDNFNNFLYVTDKKSCVQQFNSVPFKGIGELFGGDYGDQDIIFPDAYQTIFEKAPKIEGTPKCAKGNTFCEDFDSYPYHQLQDILTRKRIHTDLFGKDELPDEIYSITNRNSDFEAFVCTSHQKTVFPRVGKNKNNKWKFIINQEEREGYVQGIRIEVCRKEGSPCDLIGERINGYITSCKQKYMLRRLMSLSENGDPAPDTFQLPSACCCSYRKDLSFLSRFGAEEISARTKIKNKP